MPMTSKQRLLTAFRGGQPDRVPVVARMWKFLRKHHPDVPAKQRIFKAAEEFGLDFCEYGPRGPLPIHGPVEIPWRDDITVQVRVEMKGEMQYTHRTIETPAGTLSDVKMRAPAGPVYGSAPGPEIVEPLIKDIARDLDKVRYMTPAPDRHRVKEFKSLLDEAGERGVILGNAYSPIDCRIEDTMKQVDFLTLPYDDLSAFKELLRIGQDAALDEISAFLDAGADVVHVWWFYASISAGWSPRIYEEHFLPMVKEQVDLVHKRGGIYLYYDDGKVKETLPFIVQSGADAVMTLVPAPMGNINPAEVKQEYGGRIALMGAFDGVNEIQRGTPESIENLVAERLPKLMKNGGYLFDASNSITFETTAENVRAFCEAGHRYGQY